MMLSDEELVEAFRRWLQKQPQETVVGFPRSATHCPLAHFLQSAYPAYAWSVGLNAYTCSDGGVLVQYYALPPALQKFVTGVDRTAAGGIVASHALLCLWQAVAAQEEGSRYATR